ncbi:uncharacterized protein LOC123547013 [Mercenaria mercenaria]|uniref:uncharacterized protein LOC123547013 n=1 Tax=Mercenaria mercenaria TaxID=6596 RepID=UPI00234EF333|nr:uncharacterized protein LOC123547013 [Mercenaria mercenaria]
MSESGVDFYVIYNRAFTPRAETEDTSLSLKFTEFLVQYLEVRGHRGHYAERDAIPGSNVFKELFRNIREARKTILVVTPEFLRNCWATYSSQAAFKELLDTNKSDKLIPIGIDISDHQKLQELNITEWIHFTHDWSFTSNTHKWNNIIQALTHDGPLSTDQEYVHAQEHGDNRLRTYGETLVVQPSSLHEERKDFFSEKFLLKLGEKFPSDWKILAINLGLKDHTVTEVERNSTGNVRLQAYNALLRWKNNYGGTQESRISHLLSVLQEMGRKDLVEEIESQYKEFTHQDRHNQSVEVFDEVDMGMSRKRDYLLDLDQTPVKQPVVSHQLSNQSRNKTGDRQQHTTYVARELKAETAVIELKSRSTPEIPRLSSDLVQLQQGPSMSLPSAKVVSVPEKQVRNSPDETTNKINMSEQTVHLLKGDHHTGCRGSDVLESEQFSDIGGPKAMGYTPVCEELISATKTETVNMQSASQPGSNNNENCNNNVKRKSEYRSLQSLSKDTDLTADVNGSFSYKQQSIQDDTPPSMTPSSLNIHRIDQDALSMNLQSLSAADTTPDSGYSCSAVQTPVNDQIISDPGNQVLQNLSQKSGNKPVHGPETFVNQSRINMENFKLADNVDQFNNQTDISTSQTEVKCVEMVSTEKSTQNLPQTGMNVGDGQGEHLQNGAENDEAQADLNPASPAQDRQQSLGSTIFCALVDMLTRPQLAYN